MKRKILGILLAACMAISGPAAAYAADNLAEAAVESEAVAPESAVDAEKLAEQEMPAGMSLSLEKFVTTCADPMRSSAETGEKLAGYGEEDGDTQEMSSVEVNDMKAFAAAFKDFMLRRVSPFEILISAEVSIANAQAEIDALMEEIQRVIDEDVVAHTGKPCEGDYLRYQWGGYNPKVAMENLVPTDTTYIVTVSNKFELDYYSTAAQEQAVTEQLGEVMVGLELDGKSDYEKVKAIHDFICRNTTYDYLEDDENVTQFTAYGALIEQTAVCQGYANLFYRMCLEAGIDARIIGGEAENLEGRGLHPHAWNIVKIGRMYYNVDVTWDDLTVEDDPAYGYFLKGDDTIREDHFWSEEDRAEELSSAYPTSSEDYERSYYDDYSDDEPSFVRASLLLGGQIGVNFFLKLPEIAGCDYEDSYMEFIVNGDAANVEKAFYNPEFMNQDGRLYGFTCHVSSIQMADPIKAIFHYTVNGTEETQELDGYTVEDYIIALPNIDGIEPEAFELANALANYGYHMQRYLSEVNGWSLGGEDSAHVPVTSNTTVDYSGDRLNEITLHVDPSFVVRQRSADIQAISLSLRLDSDISLKVFFTPVEGYTGAFMAAINYDEPKEIMRSNGRYCVTIPGIWAHRIGEPYIITVTTAAGDTELWLSALDYVGICLQNSQDQLEKNAMAAMYDYYEAAQAYQRTLPMPA